MARLRYTSGGIDGIFAATHFGLRFEGVVLRRQLDEKVTFRAATCSAAPDCPGRAYPRHLMP